MKHDIETKAQTQARPKHLLRVASAGAVATAFGAASFMVAFGGEKSPSTPVTDGNYAMIILPQEALPDAIHTVGPDQRAAVEEDIKSCIRLGSEITIGPMRGAAGGTSGIIQIKSGTYVSPPLKVGAYPVMVMIPMPEVIPITRGQIEVMGQAKNLRIEMTPPLDLPDLNGSFVQNVMWDASYSCSPIKG